MLRPSERSEFGAVVLAAGASRRMGVFKPLVEVTHEPMIRRVVRVCLSSHVIGDVVVVTGRERQLIEDALAGMRVRFDHNHDYEASGMIGSIKAGLRQVGDGVDGVFIVLGDQPLIRAGTIAQLANEFDGRITRPVFQGKSGHPVLLPVGLISEVLGLAPEATLKQFIANRMTDCKDIDVADPGVTFDIDTPQDLHRALELIERSDRCEEAEVAHPQAG